MIFTVHGEKQQLTYYIILHNEHTRWLIDELFAAISFSYELAIEILCLLNWGVQI